MKVTVFKRYSEIDKPFFVDLETVLDGIKNGRVKEQIEKIRLENDDSKVKQMKMELPCVLFSGVFDIPIIKKRPDNTTYVSYRNDESLSIHSRFVCIDIDDIDEPDKYKQDAVKDEYIYALWKSPSGRGLHGLVKIADGNKHEEHYAALLNRYKVLDPTARNPSRVLFFSYDETIYINKDAKTFFEVVESSRNEGMEMSSFQTDYSKLNIAAKMIRKAEIGQRHNAVVKASYLVGGWSSGGLVEAGIAKAVLEFEVAKKFSKEEQKIEIRAVADGIKAGQSMPINQLEVYERDVIQEMGLIDEELSFLSSNQSDEEYIRRYRAGLIPMGLPFGYKTMDKYLLLKEGEFYALLSHSHTGKSTVAFWLIFISAFKYDWSWVIYTGENRTSSVKMRFIEFYVGKKIKEISEDDFQNALKWVNERIFLINNDNMHDYKSLLSFAEKTSKYHSIKGMLIDPINALKMSEKSKYEHEVEMYTDMLLFTKRTNITLIVSLHTRTQAQRERDNSGNQSMPFPADADGGAILYNKVDVFITMNRNIQDPHTWMITEIYVNKQRNKETGGDVTPKGDPITLRMNYGTEFVDEFGVIPLQRKVREQGRYIYSAPTDDEALENLNEIPF